MKCTADSYKEEQYSIIFCTNSTGIVSEELQELNVKFKLGLDFSGLQLGNGFELKHSRAKSLYIGKTVLCGDAANTFHPMAGQGLNLGIGDIMQLDENLDQLISGDMKVLSQYNKKRNNKNIKDTAIIRIEQLYPFPYDDLEEILTKYENVQEYIWCQEEPLNQGAWFSHRHRIQRVLDRFDKGDEVSLISRPAAAAPAVGLMKLHLQQQEDLINKAIS